MPVLVNASDGQCQCWSMTVLFNDSVGQ
jgi:hypothetical protein